MNISEQTKQQIVRALRKAAEKFPADPEVYPLTDICIQVKQESGEMLILNDNDLELTRCVIEAWIGNTSETFYDDIQPLIRQVIKENADVTEHFNISKPYNFVLMDDDGDFICDLYIVDDETIILSDELMEGLSEELDRIWARLEQNG